MHPASLISLAAIWAVVVISPGPCFLTVIQHSSKGSRQTGIFVALGIASGTIIWCMGSLLGLAVLFRNFVWLYNIVRVAGAAYLIWLGLRTIIGARQGTRRLAGVALPLSRRAAWRVGFLTDISNPKAAAFFSSLFAALLPPAAPFSLVVLAVALVVGIEFAWYCLAASFFSLKPVVAMYDRAKRWLDYSAGAIFIVLGLRLGTERSK